MNPSESIALEAFLAATCAECGTQGPWRHLSAVGGCQRCCAEDPRPVHVFPVRSRALTGKCHRTEGGITVHVKPDCRCRLSLHNFTSITA